MPKTVTFTRSSSLSDVAQYAYAATAPADARLVFLAGACPLDEHGTTTPVGDHAGQARQAFANLQTALADAGADVEDVISTRVLVASARRSDLVAAWDAVRSAFGEHDPPSTLVGVTVLGYPDQLVEIEAVAAVRDDAASLRPIGRVESSLRDRATAPKQGEGAPDAWLAIDPAYRDGLADLEVGAEIVVLTWLDRADRTVLATRPRDDPANPVTGVFSTRSPDRPNPIGLHRVRIRAIDGTRVRVGPLEALDGTPVLDIKPVLARTECRSTPVR